MKLNYTKIWETMNSLESVTSKIVSAREILDCAIEALENHKKDKAEALIYAADEYLQYYLQEFDSKFKDAWKETVVKIHQQESVTSNDVSIFCDNDSSSETCKNSWVDFWEENYYPDEYYSTAYDSINYFNGLRGGESEDVITFGTSTDDCMPPWGHSDMEYLSQQKEDKVVKWRLPVEMDPSREYFITFPDDLLERAGWKEKDTLEWINNNDGTFTLKKVSKTYDDMISSGYGMTDDGFWIKSDEC